MIVFDAAVAVGSLKTSKEGIFPIRLPEYSCFIINPYGGKDPHYFRGDSEGLELDSGLIRFDLFFISFVSRSLGYDGAFVSAARNICPC